MNIKLIAVMSLVMTSSLGLSTLSLAEDGAIAQDNQRISQDKKDLHQTNQDIKQTNEKIAADKASGNTAQLDKDRVSKHELKRDRKQEKSRLKQDRKEKAHDVQNP